MAESTESIIIPSDAVGKVPVLGCFDGVHLGHRALFDEAGRLSARLGTGVCALSFEEPPAFFLGDSAGLLTDTEERRGLFASLGASSAVFLRFEDIKDMSARDFIENLLIGKMKARGLVCGFNFTFGCGRSGDTELLRSYFGDRLSVVPPVLSGDAPVSSSRIRKCIACGDAEGAALMLGRPYSLSGEAVRGRGDGTSLGFATANVFPDVGRALPAPGVYAVRVTVLEENRTYNAIADAGYAPTLDKSGRYRIESHIFDFDRVLYGKHLKVEFLMHIRAEMKFASADELKARITLDTDTAKNYFASL